VSPKEKTNTKGDLARAMTKSKSKTQTSLIGCVGRKGDESCFWRGIPMSEPLLSEQIEAWSPQGKVQRDKTYDNQLRKYNEIGELLIENRTIGLQGRVKNGFLTQLKCK